MFEYVLVGAGDWRAPANPGNRHIRADGETPGVDLPRDAPAGDPEAEAAVDGGLAGAQRGQRETLGPGTPEMVVHHQTHQATAAVGGTDRDGVDGHDRDDVPAGVYPDRCPRQPGDHLASREPESLGGDHAEGRTIGAPMPAESGQAVIGCATLEEDDREQIQVGGPARIVVRGVQRQQLELVGFHHHDSV